MKKPNTEYYSSYPDQSLNRAKDLISNKGKPAKIVINDNGFLLEYPTGDFYQLGGFKVGYSGTGPDYARKFLNFIGFNYSEEDIENMSPPITLDLASIEVNIPKSSNNDIENLNPTEREKYAKDSKTPPNILEQLASLDDLQIALAIANNSSTPASALHFLNKKWYNYPSSPRFLWGHFINNPNCPGDLLREIVQNTSNPNTAKTAKNHRNFSS